MNNKNEKRGLLAHSAKAAEDRERFMASRRSHAKSVSDADQLKYFLLHSRPGVTCALVFGMLFFFSGLSG